MIRLRKIGRPCAGCRTHPVACTRPSPRFVSQQSCKKADKILNVLCFLHVASGAPMTGGSKPHVSIQSPVARNLFKNRLEDHEVELISHLTFHSHSCLSFWVAQQSSHWMGRESVPLGMHIHSNESIVTSRKASSPHLKETFSSPCPR